MLCRYEHGPFHAIIGKHEGYTVVGQHQGYNIDETQKTCYIFERLLPHVLAEVKFSNYMSCKESLWVPNTCPHMITTQTNEDTDR
jgi:hypothetical protein